MRQKIWGIVVLSVLLGACTGTVPQAKKTPCGCKKTHCTCIKAGPCTCMQPCSCNMGQKAAKHPYIMMMDEMMDAMHHAPADTRCTSTYFLTEMIVHHQAAIDMARYQIKNGQNKEMIALAHQILTEQQTEIAEMQALLAAYTRCADTDKITPSYKQGMHKTMTDMMQNMPLLTSQSNTDTSFARAMMPHHQAAIDMGMVLLNHTRDPRLKYLAENIITTQQVEINQMRAFLNANGGK